MTNSWHIEQFAHQAVQNLEAIAISLDCNFIDKIQILGKRSGSIAPIMSKVLRFDSEYLAVTRAWLMNVALLYTEFVS